MLTIDQLMAESEEVGEKANSQYGKGDMTATDLEFAASLQYSKNAKASSAKPAAEPAMPIAIAEPEEVKAVPVATSNERMDMIRNKGNECHNYLKRNDYLPASLLLSLYGLFSAIFIVANHQTPEVVCANTFSRGIVEDARLCYPDVSVLWCSGSQVLSLTGECPGGYRGEVACGGRHGTPLDYFQEGMLSDIFFNGCWSSDTLSDTENHYIIKANPFHNNEDCNPPEFGSDCTCCDGDVCETGGRFQAPVDLPIVWSEDVKYPHFGPGCTSDMIDSTWLTPGSNTQALSTVCHAYCSDGNWVDTREEANTRRVLVNLTYIFAWIGIVIEAVCFLVAIFHGVFPLRDEELPCKYFPCKPVTARTISYCTLLALGSERKRTFECRDRTTMFLTGIEAIVASVLSGIVVFKYNSFYQMKYHWGYINFFVSSMIGVLFFFKDIHKANKERLERVDVAPDRAEASQELGLSNQGGSASDSTIDNTSDSRSYKKAILFFTILSAVCATAVGLALGLNQSDPIQYNEPESVCESIGSALNPEDQEYFMKFDSNKNGGLSYTEYSAYINCLYEDDSFLPPEEWCDSNGDGEITFDEFVICVEIADFHMQSEDNDNFYSFDLDKSGGLSPVEFQKYYESSLGTGSGTFEYRLPDNYLDIYFGGDENAELTHYDFLDHPYTTMDIVDMDRDGMLSKQEFLFAFHWDYDGMFSHLNLMSDELYDQYFSEGDENADGKLSYDEWDNLFIFIARDKDGDGKWSSDEIEEMFCNSGKYLALFDKDGDAHLSYSEYLEMYRYDFPEEAASDIMLDEFNSFDYDKDGFLSRDELSKNMKCFAGYTTLQDTKGMLDLYMTVGDRDGDGKIGYIEWNFLKMAYQIDFDPKDGFISEEEFDWFVTTMEMNWEFDSFDDDKDGMISLEEWMTNAARAWGIDYNE